MSKADASATLQQVFEACGQPVSTEIDRIILGHTNVHAIYGILIAIAGAALALTLVLPLLFSPYAAGSRYSDSRADISIESFTVTEDVLLIDLSGPFININSVYATDSQGNVIYPNSRNVWSDQVSFDYNSNGEWDIYVADISGNSIHMLLTPPRKNQ